MAHPLFCIGRLLKYAFIFGKMIPAVKLLGNKAGVKPFQGTRPSNFQNSL